MSEDRLDEWHTAICRQLEEQVKNREFFLWVSVEPEEGGEGTPVATEDVDPQAWTEVAEEVEEWLARFNPDTVDPDDPPTLRVRPGDVPITLSAIPKKPRRRGSDPLILNLHRGVTYFTGSYTAGPAPELPDD